MLTFQLLLFQNQIIFKVEIQFNSKVLFCEKIEVEGGCCVLAVFRITENFEIVYFSYYNSLRIQLTNFFLRVSI